jgi:hypothetical protein
MHTITNTPNATPTPMPIFAPLDRPCDVGSSVGDEELPVLEVVLEEKVWLATVDVGVVTGGELEFEVLD